MQQHILKVSKIPYYNTQSRNIFTGQSKMYPVSKYLGPYDSHIY